MSIASDLTAVATNLKSALEEINTKIEAKGGTASETVYGVAAAVENLPSGGGDLITKVTVPFFSPKIIFDVQHYNSSDFSEFTEVEYIESTGTQYINSAYYMTPQSRVVIDQQFTSVETQARFFRASSSAGSYESYINGSKYWAYSHNNGGGDWISTYIAADTNRHTMDYDCVSNKYIISGTSVNITMEGTPTQNSTVSLTLLSRTEPTNTAAKAKLYSAQIYENGILVRNLKPCYHTQTGIIGMFDTVNNKFYTNAGTGTFLKGADI